MSRLHAIPHLVGVESAGLLAVLVIATQLGGSVLLVEGRRIVRIGVVLLAGFSAVATLLAHAFWTKTGRSRACGCSSACAVPGHSHVSPWDSALLSQDQRGFWGALGCGYWAV